MTAPSPTHGVRWLRNAAELAAFRASILAPAPTLTALAQHGALLQNHDIGVGKTTLIERMVAELRHAGLYDLIIYLASERTVLAERTFVKEALALSSDARASHDVAVLLGRPSERCGDLDEPWKRYERAGCTAIGRRRLCDPCPAGSACEWPRQLTAGALHGKRVICATQAYLQVMPGFVELVARLVGADHVLVILDEAPLMEAPFKQTLDRGAVERWATVVGAVLAGAEDDAETRLAWGELHRRLLDPTDALAAVETPPPLATATVEAIQAQGLQQFPGSFRFLGYEIPLLVRSPRWRRAGGSIVYRRCPALGRAHCLVTAAGVPLEVARRHLGLPHLHEYEGGYRFLNEGTEVINLRSRLGAARNFPKNAPQILSCFAQLIAKRTAAGHRCIAVTKKAFLDAAGTALEAHLRRVSGRAFRVVSNPDRETCDDPLVVPLLHYGVRGVNTYEAFDTAIALNSYNARADVMQELLNDPHAPGAGVRVEVSAEGSTRVAHVPEYWHQRQGFGSLAMEYQQLTEAVWAEQTLGRVRFTVRPRLVIFFQTGGVRFEATEFTSLEPLRRHFGLASDRQRAADLRRAEVIALTGAGETAAEIAARLGVDIRTVRRHRQG